MKILTGSQIREADVYTMENEPIASIDLVERAATRMVEYLTTRYSPQQEFGVFAGKGNNGADGLAVARLLYEQGYRCTVYTLFPESEGSEEYRINLMRLPDGISRVAYSPQAPLMICRQKIIIDAMLGTGVSGELKDPIASAARLLNTSGCEVVAIDVPSGMLTEFGNAGRLVVDADVTLALQFPKLSLLLPESGENVGELVVIPIGLHERFRDLTKTPYFYTTERSIEFLMDKRSKYSHKGDYGHALLICGSESMMGAAILATGGALRSGCGLVTVHVPWSMRTVINVTNPPALLSFDKGSRFSEVPSDLEKYTTIGIGSGMGQAPESFKALKELFKLYRRPMVIDADAINILSSRKELISHIPEGSLLTPHPGELKRLIGDWEDDREKLDKTLEFCRTNQCLILIKGAHTALVGRTGEIWFNSTGNPGMAKGGSGDVLTGLLTGLLARGATPSTAAIMAAYFHGKAGDLAAEALGQESMNASDIVNYLPPKP